MAVLAWFVGDRSTFDYITNCCDKYLGCDINQLLEDVFFALEKYNSNEVKKKEDSFI